MPALAVAAALFLVPFLLPLPEARADGTVNVTVGGSGEGTVTSTCASSNVGGTCTPTPGQLSCTKAGGAGCSTFFDFDFFGFLHEGTAILTATPGPGSLFTGWTQSGATSTQRCTTPPQADPTCVVALNPAAPGPTSTVTATFVAVPDVDPLPLATGSSPGAAPYLRSLEGTVDPEGFEVTGCHFEYDTVPYAPGEAGHGTRTPCVPAAVGGGDAPVSVSASTEPLEPQTTYHFRLVASNVISTGDGGTAASIESTFTTDAIDDECSDPETGKRRAEQGIAALLLPDCMALEMVSPPKKGGQPAKNPHVSADGNRVKFFSSAALAGTPLVMGLSGNAYVATRGASGWMTAYTMPPWPLAGGWSRDLEAKSFTPDFSRWFHIAGSEAQVQLGIARAYRGALGGLSEPLSPLLVPEGGGEGRFVVTRSKAQAVSADHSHLVFEVGGVEVGPKTTSYLAGDPEPAPNNASSPATSNVYIAKLGATSDPSIELLARGIDAADGKVKVFGGNCGARVGNIEGPAPSAPKRNQGAISSDGSRVIFSTRPTQPATGNCLAANNLRIFERVETASGPVIRELFKSECDRKEPTCNLVGGDDLFQGASLDQGKVYFTTTRQLAASDLDAPSFSSCTGALVTGCDLYLYDSSRPVGQRLIQVSAGESVAGHEIGSGAKVHNGTVAISADGSRVYFVAEGVLTDDPGPEEDKASDYAANAPKLYVWDAEAEVLDDADPLNDGEALAFVGALSPADKGITDLWGGQGTWRNEAYPVPVRDESGGGVGDGRVLVFLSKASLTADDGDEGFQDAFRYDAEADELVRISEASAGGSNDGPFDLAPLGDELALDPAGTDFAEAGRWVSEDGDTVVFQTAEPLVPGDANGRSDIYMWREGELYRLPGTTESNPPTLSHDGNTVAFQADPRLLPQDGDTSSDIYVARVGGGYPNPVAEIQCEADRSQPGPHCRDEAASSPEQATPGTVFAPSAGNLSPRPNCGGLGRRAQKLSTRAKRLSHKGRRMERRNPRRARRMNRTAKRLAKRAKGFSDRTKRCRQSSRRAGR